MGLQIPLPPTSDQERERPQWGLVPHGQESKQTLLKV